MITDDDGECGPCPSLLLLCLLLLWLSFSSKSLASRSSCFFRSNLSSSVRIFDISCVSFAIFVFCRCRRILKSRSSSDVKKERRQDSHMTVESDGGGCLISPSASSGE